MVTVGRPPVTARLIVAAVAGVVAAFTALEVDALLGLGLPLTAAAYVVASTPYVLLLAAISIVPRWLQLVVSRYSEVQLGRRGHVAAVVLLATTLLVVFGQGSLVPFTYDVETRVLGDETPSSPALSETGILVSVLFNIVIFVLPVLAWLVYVNGVEGRDLARHLGLRRDGNVRAALAGFGIALLGILTLMLLAAVLFALGVEMPENERALEIGAALSLPGVVLLSLAASISEETFFRAYLQPRLGIVLQAVLFSLAHLSYFNTMEVVATFLLGLLFGLGYRATGNLVAPLVGHFAFNLIMLVLMRFPLPA